MLHIGDKPWYRSSKNNKLIICYISLPYAEYEDKTIMCAEALLIEYQKGAVLPDALNGVRYRLVKGFHGLVSPCKNMNNIKNNLLEK